MLPGLYLDILAVVSSFVVQLAEQTLLSVLASIGELPQSVLVDVLDRLAHRSFNEPGIAAALRCISTSTHDEDLGSGT